MYLVFKVHKQNYIIIYRLIIIYRIVKGCRRNRTHAKHQRNRKSPILIYKALRFYKILQSIRIFKLLNDFEYSVLWNIAEQIQIKRACFGSVPEFTRILKSFIVYFSFFGKINSFFTISLYTIFTPP